MTAGPPHDQPGHDPRNRPPDQPGQYQPPPGYQPMPQPPQYQWTGQQPPPGYPAAPPYGQPSGTTGTSDKGFFGSLFDYSFHSFVTPRLVKIVFILATVVIGLTYVGFVIDAFRAQSAVGVFVLIFGAIGAIFYLAFIRMTLEFLYAVVRMSQDINQRLPYR
jgi:hypothetical protein